MYESPAPDWAGNTAGLPWNQSVPPIGWLLFCMYQSGRFVMSSNPSLTVQATQPVTVVEADAEAEPWLSVVKLAVLSYCPHEPLGAALTTSASVLEPPGSVVGVWTRSTVGGGGS